MTRRRNHRETRFTTPDHRPMLPEFRQPGDVLDAVIREHRRRLDELDPTQRMKWR